MLFVLINLLLLTHGHLFVDTSRNSYLEQVPLQELFLVVCEWRYFIEISDSSTGWGNYVIYPSPASAGKYEVQAGEFW